MILKVIEDMPPADKWIFIVRSEFIDVYHIDNAIKTIVVDPIFIRVDKTTEGQACTALLAEPYLDPDEPVFIAACDNAALYDEGAYRDLLVREDVDAVVWTFTRQEILRDNPRSWGWVKTDEDGRKIQEVSVKVPISDDPYNDHAIAASFFFKRAADFLGATRKLVEDDLRVNGEFYMDSVPQVLLKMGKTPVIFDVDLYISWGTPRDLYVYQRMEYFLGGDLDADLADMAPHMRLLWKKYFSGKRAGR